MRADEVEGSRGDGDWFKEEVLSSESDSDDDDQGLALVELSSKIEPEVSSASYLDPYPSWIRFWFFKR